MLNTYPEKVALKFSNLSKYNKGISLLEVSYFLILMTGVILFVNNYFFLQKESCESTFITQQIKKVTTSLNLYIKNLPFSADQSFPYEVTTSELIDRGFLSKSINTNSSLVDHEDNYILKFQTGDNSQHYVIAGLTFLCMDHLRTKSAMILNQLGFSGGSLTDENPSTLVGGSGAWHINLDDYKKIYSNPLIRKFHSCIFSISSYEPVVNKRGDFLKPNISSGDLNIVGMSANIDASLNDGGSWQPLFESDAIIINNNSNIKNVIIEVYTKNTNKLLSSKYYSGNEDKIFVSNKYLDRSLYLKVIPVDSSGHRGDPVTLPQNGYSINVTPYEGNLFKKINYLVQADIYNKDFSLPLNPRNDTRSDVGQCGVKGVTTPAGIDIKDLQLNLITSYDNSAYLKPHTFALMVNGVNILSLKVINPSLALTSLITLKSYDIRKNHILVAPGLTTTGNGFYLINKSCQKNDSEKIHFSISIDNITHFVDAINWVGTQPLWKPDSICITDDSVANGIYQ
ncbi:hypothetical protein SAMN05216516_102278 [Izhakiella capsodis]|uniref:Uncharacterized protein n=1 Tax=Izhakiella capsodis TaxID=1367852 RepID=A0A1I4W4K2_9GAMM|nr:hypothetical protein [Izhakiella capsodis]SFN08327.1 hypothetical protein SAMN05216516_102278 [Izhakiella capsodis]